MKANKLRSAGFGLLEVLVSLVIFAGVGLTLVAWFRQSVESVHRLQEFYEQQEARKWALDLARGLNPSLAESGEARIDGLRLVWTAKPLGNEAAQSGYPTGTGRHRIRLYMLTLSLYRGNSTQAWFVEQLKAVGHRPNSLEAG